MDADDFDVDAINEEFAVVLNGGTAMIVRERTTTVVEDRLSFVRVDSFKVMLGNRFKRVRGPDGKEKDISWATAWLADRRRRQYDGIEFHPDRNNAGGTSGHLNLWRGFSYDREKAGLAKFLRITF